MPKQSDLWRICCQDFGKLLDEQINCDVFIKVGRQAEIFKAHSLILTARSSYFTGAFSQNWVKKDEGIYHLSMPNIAPRIFEIILRYIYTGYAPTAQTIMNPGDMFAVLKAADELLMQDLIDFVGDEIEDDWIKENVDVAIQSIMQYPLWKSLRARCFRVFCIDTGDFLRSNSLPLVDESFLKRLLKLETLSVTEIEIWDGLVRWARGQLEDLPNSTKKWSKNQMSDFADIIENFLPLIRFHEISRQDINDKVLPYKDSLSYKVRNKIIDLTYCSPNTLFATPRFMDSSAILSSEEIAQILSWIDDGELGSVQVYELNEIPYYVRLLIRGTRDGFESKTFTKKCLNKKNCILVMRVSETDEIIGGYAPSGFARNSTKDFPHSFLFSFGDDGEEKPKRGLPYVPDNEEQFVDDDEVNYALAFDTKFSNDGPRFGNGDLWMRGNFDEDRSCICQPNDYRPITRTTHFSVDEYEIFQLLPFDRYYCV
ncbi:3981_t:CDS:2 [Ambispora gerdemannii]|uniref:3981_t:CDS:1 n=1 Tax=Ambispora gerdemannii TaxID=144530 RepID=A0A9N9C592_9GLOM|nr:3981_t:CDS:2 [Ambispora gerdemannii]